ncbi:hypothetical protein [Falsiroseomonas sp.]|uniref:hypothetical protein n=1 Tax=Falsiroseomonas sp. TaxID=2870721 RepID=UPI003F709A0A
MDTSQSPSILRRLGLTAAVLTAVMLLLEASAPAREPELDAAEAWNLQISKLGITPVYPPTEDLHVGDVWALLIPPALSRAAVSQEPLLTRAIRLGHSDQREAILASAHRRPVFAEVATENPALRTPRLEHSDLPESQRIPLALVGFPSVSRTLHAERSGRLSTLIGTLSGSASRSVVEEISVPEAHGYGIEPLAAATALQAWCRTRPGLCQEGTIRTLLSFALGREMVTPEARVELLMVSYVFATRHIRLTRHRSDDGQADLETNPDQVAGNQAKMKVIRASSSGVEAQNVFPRPVVIGFRSVTFAFESLPQGRSR